MPKGKKYGPNSGENLKNLDPLKSHVRNKKVYAASRATIASMREAKKDLEAGRSTTVKKGRTLHDDYVDHSGKPK